MEFLNLKQQQNPRELILAWLAAALRNLGIRVLVGVPIFFASAAAVLGLSNSGVNISNEIQIGLIAGLSAALFWFVTELIENQQRFVKRGIHKE